jgi:hypothetical protein
MASMKDRTLPRKPVVLSESTQRRLGMYALAASAAGVSLLALAPPGEAKVIYTKAHEPINVGGANAKIDLNHDGIVDFVLYIYSEPHGYSNKLYCFNYYYRSNSMAQESANLHYREGVADIKPDQTVGSKRDFGLHGTLAGVRFHSSGPRTYFGPWANGRKGVNGRYAGLQFTINGKIHYGWARINVYLYTSHNFAYFYGLLTGYAYETIPKKAIVTRKTSGPDVITLPADIKAGTLGHLALGRK